MRVLVTGFEPFDGETVNPSFEAVSALPDSIGGAEIVKLEMPVVFGKAGEKLAGAIAELKPDVVICVGLSGSGDSFISVERVALNLIDARIPDNDGKQPEDVPVKADGDIAYFATVPAKKMVKAMQKAGIPATLSFTAGTYVCNSLMYEALYLAQKKYPGMRAGFIHVPYSQEQVAMTRPSTPSMNIGDMTKGLTIAIETAVKEK